MSELFIGYMSGTSCDGVDASLIETDGKSMFRVIANTHIPYPQEFKFALKKQQFQILSYTPVTKIFSSTMIQKYTQNL